MWIAKKDNWNPATKPLEKFVIERILQRCDYSEVISNKFRSINGFTQLKEIIHYCEVTRRRSKTGKTLLVIIDEAKSDFVSQNLLNDIIIKEYFDDLIVYLKKRIDSDKLMGEKMQPNHLILDNIYRDLRIFEKQLDERYFDCLVTELKKIDYQEEKKIQRSIERLSHLIDLLIPYLIFKGFSTATISEILRSWLRSGYHITVSKFLSFLHFRKRPFTFLQFVGNNTDEGKDFIELLRNGLDVEIKELPADSLDPSFLARYKIPSEGIFAKYEYKTIDPHKHVRSNFDGLLKDLVIRKERQSLAVFNSFFDHSFWSNRTNLPFEKFRTISLDGDPINVSERGKTLRVTLDRLSKILKIDYEMENGLPPIECEQLSNSIYYYNLALGSKSIENSLSLLWTSLEAVQPYKVYSADIDAVQNMISKGLGIGSIGRDINSFASRFHQFSAVNDDCLKDKFIIDFPSSSYPDGLLNWYSWICDEVNSEANFKLLKKHSELLAYQYLSLGKNILTENQGFLLNRINRSESSIRFQLQRIYHHRNKIVHSGDMINEYTNLWMHLEWYVGKILAYFIIELHYLKNSNTLEDAFMRLEADRDYLVSYLQRNKDIKIVDMPARIRELIFKQNWQFF